MFKASDITAKVFFQGINRDYTKVEMGWTNNNSALITSI